MRHLIPVTSIVCLGAWACQPLGDLDAAAAGSNSSDTSAQGETTDGPTDINSSVSSTSASASPTTTQDTRTSGTLPAGPDPTPTQTSAVTSTAITNTAVTSNSHSETIQPVESEPAPLETTEPESSLGSSSVTSESSGSGLATFSSEPPVANCESKCAMGATCTTIQQCASLRCDDVCEPMEFVVRSDGIDAVSTSVKMHVELFADPAVPVAWQDLAVLYFFTAEKRDDFKLNYAQGGGSALAMQVTLKEWILVWTSDEAGNVPNTVTDFDVQLHSYPWLPDTAESNNNANDYSYRAEPGLNDKIVLCRRIDGEWRHVQGTPPPEIPDPCHYVNNCDAAISCDTLEPSPGP